MTEFVVYDVFGKDGFKKPRDKSGARFPFLSMDVGDFFDVPLYMKHDVYSSLHWYSNRYKMRFDISTFKDDLVARCTRVA